MALPARETPTSTDEALHAAWRRGDKEAGEALFDRHFDAVYRFLARRTDGEAVDLVQATFLAVLEGKESFRGESTFRTYLYAVARRKLVDHWRSKKRRPELDVAGSSLAALGPSPSSCVGRAEEVQHLGGALDSLPMDLQIVLQLYWCEGLSAPELAVVLDIPEGTVRSRLRRAREALLEALASGHAAGAALGPSLVAIEDWSDTLRAAFAVDP